MQTCRSFLLRLAAASLLAVAAPSGFAANHIYVAPGEDTLSTNGICGLREALINAAADDISGSFECRRGDGADVIALPPQTLIIASAMADDANVRTGDIDITGTVEIVGAGALYSRLDARLSGRVFDVQPGATLILRDMAVVRGLATDVGAAIRVQAGGTLVLDRVAISSSEIDVASASGFGAGIYLASGAVATIDDSEFSWNLNRALTGEGGAIYCDGCTLAMSRSTVTANEAGLSAGGLYLANGSDATLSFVTLGKNQAIAADGIYNAGTLAVSGSILADNGAGAAGDDLTCSGVETLSDSVIEFPGGCTYGADVLDRPDLPALAAGAGLNAVPTDLLQPIGLQPIDSQPSRVLQLSGGGVEYYLGDALASALCPVRDQLGNARQAGIACDYGAFHRPDFFPSRMAMFVTLNATPLGTINFISRGAVSADTLVHVEAIGGIGETCNFSQDVTIPNGLAYQTMFVDPSLMFSLPAFGRTQRVCRLRGTVMSGDPRLVGSETGELTIIVNDNSASAADGISSPAVNTYLNIGTVPVSTGATGLIRFHPDVGGWNITGLELQLDSAGRFQLNQNPTPASPLPVLDAASGGTSISVTCLPGTDASDLGDADAYLKVTTDNPTFPEIYYGVRCNLVHFLGAQASAGSITEGDDPAAFILSLDSPALIPFDVQVDEVYGVQLQPEDFVSFAGVVSFAVGEQEKSIPVAVVDDLIIREPSASLGMEASVLSQPLVQLLNYGQASLTVNDNDEPVQDIYTEFREFVEEGRGGAGQRDQFWAYVENTGTDPLVDVSLTINVDKPMWIYSFALGDAASCDITPERRTARCRLVEPLDPGEFRQISGEIEFARMSEAPELAVTGVARLRATGRTGATSVEAEDSARYVVEGRVSSYSGLGALAPALFGLLSLLALRRRRHGRVAG